MPIPVVEIPARALGSAPLFDCLVVDVFVICAEGASIGETYTWCPGYSPNRKITTLGH